MGGYKAITSQQIINTHRTSLPQRSSLIRAGGQLSGLVSAGGIGKVKLESAKVKSELLLKPGVTAVSSVAGGLAQVTGKRIK